MTEPLRTLHFPLPGGWEDADATTVPPLPWMQHTGIAVEAVRSARHTDDAAALAVYALRGRAAAVERLSVALRKRLGAISTGEGLSWAVAGEDWVSLSALLAPAAVEGPAILCTTRFPKASAAAHVDAVTEALGQAKWRW